MTLRIRRPTSLTDAIAELADGESLPLAGGMSVVLLMNTGLLDPERLVSLTGVPALDGVRDVDGTLEIGAMCTHHQLSVDPVLTARVPEVAAMFGHIGNVRVRAWATVGGNLAHADPAQDPAVLLGALGATVVAEGRSGRREIAVRDLATGPFATVLDPDELLTTIRLPVPDGRTRCAYVKFLPRTADDYATVSAAVRIELDDAGTVVAADVVLGSVGPTTVVASDAAAALLGRPIGDPGALDDLAAGVRDVVSPISDSRGSSSYRREMAGVMAQRAVKRTMGAAL